jgi:hypothetical protein
MHERHASRPAGGYGYPVPPEAGMSGTGLVADDLHLLAHDDRTPIRLPGGPQMIPMIRQPVRSGNAR